MALQPTKSQSLQTDYWPNLNLSTIRCERSFIVIIIDSTTHSERVMKYHQATQSPHYADLTPTPKINQDSVPTGYRTNAESKQFALNYITRSRDYYKPKCRSKSGEISFLTRTRNDPIKYR